MTTYDTTVSMLKQLPENDLNKVLSYIRETFFTNEEVSEDVGVDLNPFRSVTEDEVLQSLEDRRNRIKNGEELLDAHHASSIIRERYGIKHA